MATYNEYQRMYYIALYGRKKTKKDYGLYEADNLIMIGDYPLLVHTKKLKEKQGLRFLSIKPIN